MEEMTALEEALAINFHNKEIALQAMTHRSYLNENKFCSWGNNERLELLGDRVLEVVAVVKLLKLFPEMSEGEITELKSALVNNARLARVAERLELYKFILVSKGETNNTYGWLRIKAGVFEAIVGAIYLDQGLEKVQEFLFNNNVFSKGFIKNTLDRIRSGEINPKGLFQHKAQKNLGVEPTYTVLEKHGPEVRPEFIVGVYLGDELVAKSAGESIALASQRAARSALEIKGWLPEE